MLRKIASKGVHIATHPVLSKYFGKNRLTILMYHGVVKEPLMVRDWCFIDLRNFTEQMQYLKVNFDVLPLSQAVKKLQCGGIQDPTVSVTLDDGFLNNYEVAFPITSALEIPITIYVSTRFVDTNYTLWYCRLNLALSKTKRRYFEWRDMKFSIENDAQKAKVSSLLQGKLKELSHIDMLKELDGIIAGLGLDPKAELDRNSPFRMLDSEAINLISQSRNVEIGAHTHSHAILSKLSPMQKRKEIVTSIRLIEKWTKSGCRTFAYPNGRSEDYDAECINLLKNCNIEAALTANRHRNTLDTSRFELGRYGIGSDTGFDSFKLLVHGVTPLLKQFRSKFTSRI